MCNVYKSVQSTTMHVKMKLESSEKIFSHLLLIILLFYVEVNGNYFGTNSEKDDQCFCKVF